MAFTYGKCFLTRLIIRPAAAISISKAVSPDAIWSHSSEDHSASIFACYWHFFGSWPGSAFAPDELNWSFTPYLSASNTTVDLTFLGNNRGLANLTFKDLLDALDKIVMVQVETRRGTLSACADIANLATPGTTQSNLVNIDAASKAAVVDVGAAFRPYGIDGAVEL